MNDRDLAERVVWKAAEGLEGRNELVEEMVGKMPSAEVFQRFPSHEDLRDKLPAITWLWPGWIPVGLLSLLGAAPGAGKSLVALDLARRIIHGDRVARRDAASGDAGRVPRRELAWPRLAWQSQNQGLRLGRRRVRM